MQNILDAIMADDDDATRALAAIPVPATYRGVTVRADETTMFAGLTSREKDPRRFAAPGRSGDPHARPG